MKRSILIVTLIAVIYIGKGQNLNTIKIGEKVPDLYLGELVNHSTSSASLSDYKGKAIILDFWATWCGACIAAFPKIDSMQRIYDKDITVLLATHQSKEEVKNFFKKALWQQYKFPSIVNDTILNQHFPHLYIPHQIWIDKNGIVRSINNGRYMTNEWLLKFINGEILDIPDATALADRRTQNGTDPLIIYDYQQYGLDNLFSYGYVSKFQKDIKGSGSMRIDRERGTIRLSYKNLHWTTLLRSSLFSPGETFHMYSMIFRKDSKTLKNIGNYVEADNSDYFCYDGIIKDTILANAQEMMHAQLDAAFQTKSYKETRKIKVYILKEYGTEHIYRNAENQAEFDKNSNPNIKYYVNNLKFFVNFINGSWSKLKHPLINEVPYTGKAYFQYDFSSDDPVQLSQKLREFGLEIVEGERELNVLVIEDR